MLETLTKGFRNARLKLQGKTTLSEDNIKAWSGDHGVDPRIVPGVLFCTHKIDDEDPALMDIAPTAMRLFGMQIPPHMEGKSLFSDETLTGDTLSDMPSGGGDE